jgi:hypothetical protein
MRAAALAAAGHANIDRRFLDAFELQTPVEGCAGPFVTPGRLCIRLFEELFYGTLRRALTDDHKIPRLHKSNRPGVMRCGQDSPKHIVSDRRPHKIAPDVPPLENHAVDGCPLMVGELSITGTQPVGRQTHTTLLG